MATGMPPFRGDTIADVALAITSRQPARVRSLNPRAAGALETIIERALQKNPADRYPSVGEMLDDLRQARRAAEIPAPPEKRHFRVSRAVAGVTLALIVVLALTGSARGWWGLPMRSAPPRNSVLVSTIANGTADPDFDGTLREAVTVYLGQSPYLNLVSDERVRSTLQLMGRDPSVRLTHDVGADVCERLGLQAMLEGSVSAVGRVDAHFAHRDRLPDAKHDPAAPGRSRTQGGCSRCARPADRRDAQLAR